MKARLLFLILCGLLGSLTAHARTWTSTDGRKIEADFLRMDGDSAVLRVNGKEVPVPLSRLSPADQSHLTALQQEAAAALTTLLGQPVVPGQEVLADCPVTNPVSKKFIDAANPEPCPTIKMRFVPSTAFDPTRDDVHVLVVHATTSGKALSLNVSRNYEKVALEKGYWRFATLSGRRKSGRG